jgi:hypothetical protein
MAFLVGVRAGRDTPTHIQAPSYTARAAHAQPPQKPQASPKSRARQRFPVLTVVPRVVGTPWATCIIEPTLASNDV